MIPDERLQHLIDRKDTERALRFCQEHGYSESWSIIDGALVIYNLDDPPSWIPPDEERDENGYTQKFVEDHADALDEAIVSHSRSFWSEPPGVSRRQAEKEKRRLAAIERERQEALEAGVEV